MADLRARILRGAFEVGGSCVEVEHDGARLVIDVGLPLHGVDRYRDLLPDVPGLWSAGDGSLLAVLVSHTHPDHCGLADLVPPEVPILCGSAAERVWNAASFFVPRMTPFAAAGHFAHGRSMTVGPFRVTPWLVDHSGYGAYSLMIEAGGRRLLYSGDIRATGRKPRTLGAIADAAVGVDALLLEGTRIGASNRSTTESAVENRVAALLDATDGIGLAFFSAMNIDRLVSLYRAARRVGRTFVMDLYTASVARATGNPRVPQTEWDGVRVYLPRSQRRRVIASENFTLLDSIRTKRIYMDEIEDRARELVVTARASLLPELYTALSGAAAIWSMWEGYLDRDSGLQRHLRGYGFPVHRIHASGHASRDDLRAFAATVQAHAVVPIHTDRPKAFFGAVDNVRPRADGQWWNV